MNSKMRAVSMIAMMASLFACSDPAPRHQPRQRKAAATAIKPEMVTKTKKEEVLTEKPIVEECTPELFERQNPEAFGAMVQKLETDANHTGAYQRAVWRWIQENAATASVSYSPDLPALPPLDVQMAGTHLDFTVKKQNPCTIVIIDPEGMGDRVTYKFHFRGSYPELMGMIVHDFIHHAEQSCTYGEGDEGSEKETCTYAGFLFSDELVTNWFGGDNYDLPEGISEAFVDIAVSEELVWSFGQSVLAQVSHSLVARHPGEAETVEKAKDRAKKWLYKMYDETGHTRFDALKKKLEADRKAFDEIGEDAVSTFDHTTYEAKLLTVWMDHPDRILQIKALLLGGMAHFDMPQVRQLAPKLRTELEKSRLKGKKKYIAYVDGLVKTKPVEKPKPKREDRSEIQQTPDPKPAPTDGPHPE